ncbi:MAG: NarK family nitrate/nitrite MFS transporter [Betaproteobacteria bacterium]|nr:NarK family nitrate/nitrite MFS transporter [Betaproteobacteria bacterium]
MASHILTRWDPEDPVFWEKQGREIANRNLWISIPSLSLAFAVWMVWSVVVVNLPNAGFSFTTEELFWLSALPALCGATLRSFYSFMVPIFGGRRWTAISTVSLLLPTLGMAFAVRDPSTGYPTFVILALLCGFGGGNFASSMANINFFFPKVQKGTALGLNAGLGNLGVSLAQFVVPLVITAGMFGSLGGEPQIWMRGAEAKQMWLQNAGLIWVPFIAIFALAAWFGMHDLATAKAPFSDQIGTLKSKHNWIMCWLYLGTFGSFIGYSAGFPLLIKSQFPQVDALTYAWLGPLMGALIRPLGGWLSDRLGGAKVTFWNFIAMAAGVIGVLAFLPHDGQGGNFYGFLAMFMLLFLTAGIGNGSTFRMIPVIFLNQRQREAAGRGRQAEEQAIGEANREAATVLGFASAIGAYGGFFIPMGYGTSISMTGGPAAALYGFIVFYVTCIAMTWWYYLQRSAEMPC